MPAHVPFSESDLIGGTPYQVKFLVGVGGMGSVYEVEHLELGKRFILKCLLPELACRADIVDRLRTEWRALGKLEHANIVGVTDAGVTSGGVPFYVMERLVGETVYERVDRQGHLDVNEALRITVGVLDGLSAAHAIGVVHRDVKPANVFLTESGGVKLLDFGIAKVLDADRSHTSTGVSLGTPRYMSPEQVLGESLSGQADVYAAGLILFEMLAGRSPFAAVEQKQWLLCHLNREPPRCSSIAHQPVPPEVDLLIADMLKKNPLERPANAKTAAARVRELLVRSVSRRTRPSTTKAREQVERDGFLLTLPDRMRAGVDRETLRPSRETVKVAPPNPAAEGSKSSGEPGTLELGEALEVRSSDPEAPTRTAAVESAERRSGSHVTPPPVAPSVPITGWRRPRPSALAFVIAGVMGVIFVAMLVGGDPPVDGAAAARGEVDARDVADGAEKGPEPSEPEPVREAEPPSDLEVAASVEVTVASEPRPPTTETAPSRPKAAVPSTGAHPRTERPVEKDRLPSAGLEPSPVALPRSGL